MPDVSNGAVLEVVIRSTLWQQEFMSIFHYKLTEQSSPADQYEKLEAADTRLALIDGLYDAYQACVTEDLEFQETQLQWIYPVRYAYRRFPMTFLVGALAPPTAPPNTAVTLTKKGEEANRRNIGSTHMPGVAMSAIDEGRLHADLVDTYATLGTRIKTPYTMATGGTLVPIILNRTLMNASPEIKSVVTQDTIRVQRRRTVGLGI